MNDRTRGLTKASVEKLLIRLGFETAIVRLAQRTNDGQEEIECYKYNNLYCMITFLQHYSINGELKDWVLIEYADSLYEAERWMFDDGDMIPLDVPIEQIITELKVELVREIK